jgi:serine/threonine-protein kinase
MGDRYEVRGKIGAGGMGEVIAARDEQVGRDVAIKRMLREDPNERQVARFLREARIQGRLDHPAIVPVHEIGRDGDGRPFFVMKKLAGTTLAAILDGEATPERGRERLLHAFVGVCLAVEFAHVRGVVHRDLKPANIVLGEFGDAYVLDWGIAKLVGETDDVFEDIRGTGPGTVTGAVVGTPGYMAPEQAEGRDDIGSPADVYALGRVLEEILASGPQPPPPELEAACQAAQADDPSQRPTARALSDRLQGYLDGDRDLDRRRKLAAEHLAGAREAHASGDPEARARAINLAGRALALDPESAETAGMLSSLLLEPPAEYPAPLRARLAEEDRRATLVRMRAGVLTLLSPLALLAAIPFLVVRNWTTVILAYATVAVSLLVGRLLYATGRTTPVFGLAATLAVSIAFTRAAGLFMLTPTVIALSLLAITANPYVHTRRWLVAVWLLAATLLPLALEATGVFERTLTVTNAGFRVTSAMFEIENQRGFPTLLITNFMVLAAVALYGLSVNGRSRAAQERLEVQAWHLQQLLPATSSLQTP